MEDASLKRNDNITVEVNEKKLDDGVSSDDANAKGTLNTLKVEFYEALNSK